MNLQPSAKMHLQLTASWSHLEMPGFPFLEGHQISVPCKDQVFRVANTQRHLPWVSQPVAEHSVQLRARTSPHHAALHGPSGKKVSRKKIALLGTECQGRELWNT